MSEGLLWVTLRILEMRDPVFERGPVQRREQVPLSRGAGRQPLRGGPAPGRVCARLQARHLQPRGLPLSPRLEGPVLPPRHKHRTRRLR
ncbi:hypothetical protein evm_014098 [Chilo suppressalis]|nr:hypothetical protein evm_014098 [Chilo suppressalis]